MPAANPSIVSHLSIGVSDFDRAVVFYDKVLATLGCRRMEEYPQAIAYGKAFPEFWVQAPINDSPATNANGFHIGFVASSKEEVVAFYEAAIAAGARDAGAPGGRELYGPNYFGCFVHDLDGHKIEATFIDETGS